MRTIQALALRNMKYFILLTTILTVLFINLTAQDSKKELTDDAWKLTGQAQIRPELDGRDFSNKTYPLTFTTARFRFGVEKNIFENVSFVVMAQDGRVWGQELGPTNNIANIDLYQGYVKINNIFGQPIYAQAGRFEVSYSDQRIFGSSQWSLYSRSWDGLRLGYNTKDAKVDVFALTNSSNMPAISKALPGSYSYPATMDSSFNVYGFYSQWLLKEGHNLDVYGYYDINKRMGNKTDADLARFTAGARYQLTLDNLFGVAEFAYQMGDSAKRKVGAYLALVTLGYNFAPFKISLNIDMQSGTKSGDTTNYNMFDANYSTKHAINGYMDYFADMFKGTKGLGLNDYFLKIAYEQKDNPFLGELTGHYFMSNKPLPTPNGDLSKFGEEIDLVLKYKMNKAVTLEWGGCLFLQGDLMKELYKSTIKTVVTYREDPAFWSYVMLRLNI